MLALVVPSIEIVKFLQVNDIALIKLTKSIEFTKYIQPICLNKADDYSDGKQMATLAGWGRTSVIGLGGSPTLRHATMRVWNNTECVMRYSEIEGSTPKVEPTMVCAGSPGIDACQVIYHHISFEMIISQWCLIMKQY